jgi:glycerate kinase
MRPVLIAPGAFADLRASQVAAAIGRGLERAGFEIDLCPATGGGPGTLETLLVALGGEAVAGGFALVEGGATAIVDATPDPVATAAALAAALDGGASTLVLAADGVDVARDDVASALGELGGLGNATLLVLGDDAPGAPFVLDALGYDERMRAARAVIVGAGTIARSDLRGTLIAEAATRARQSGVPCFAIAGHSDLDRFDSRMLDIEVIETATTLKQIERAAQALAPHLPSS